MSIARRNDHKSVTSITRKRRRTYTHGKISIQDDDSCVKSERGLIERRTMTDEQQTRHHEARHVRTLKKANFYSPRSGNALLCSTMLPG